MKYKTAREIFLAVLALSLTAFLFIVPLKAVATTKPVATPEKVVVPAPAPVTSQSSSQSGASSVSGSASTSGSASEAASGSTSAIGSISPAQALTSEGSRSWSFFVQPPAFTPPMSQIAGCAPLITQEAVSGWLVIGGASKATAKTDPSDCTLMALRNEKVAQCQYASAKQIEDLLIAKLLPDFKASPSDAFVDLDPRACAALKAPPKPEPEVRYVTIFEPQTECKVQPEPAKPAAKKTSKTLKKRSCTPS